MPLYFAANSYEDQDDHGPEELPQFHPVDGAQGPQLPAGFEPTCELDFFKLFFSDEVVDAITGFTNAYARAHISRKPSYGRRADGHWEPTTREEQFKLLALLCQGLNKLPELEDYWRVTSLCNGAVLPPLPGSLVLLEG